MYCCIASKCLLTLGLDSTFYLRIKKKWSKRLKVNANVCTGQLSVRKLKSSSLVLAFPYWNFKSHVSCSRVTFTTENNFLP